MEEGTSRGKWSAFKQKIRKLTLIEWLVIIAVITVTVALLLPAAPRSYGGHPRWVQCGYNLHQLSLALQNYHDWYGTYPPAYIADANGKPMHSWRVLILPFIEQQRLYEKYRFDEPWDGPNNRKLHSEKVVPFLCFGSRGEEFDQNWTSYVAVIGPQTAWPGVRPLKLEEITDDKEQTILLVEMKNSGIHWMEPRDLNFDEMSFQANDPEGNSIGSWHKETVNGFFGPKEIPVVVAAYVEGRPRRLPRNITPETLKSLLTIRGGEKIDPKELEW